MFTLVVTFKIKPDHISTFTQALSKVRNHTRLEPGNVVYEFSVDETDVTRVFLYEKYSDRSAYEFHTQQNYLHAFRAEIGDCVEETPTVLRGNLHT